MILPLAALLLQISAIPEVPAFAVSGTTVEIGRAAVADKAAKTDVSAAGLPGPKTPVVTPSTPESPAPGTTSPVSEPIERSTSAAPIPLSAPVSFSQSMLHDRSERARRRAWIALAIAQHGAAAFDAWSTRRALSTGDAQESNPMLRPFAGNASIYAATQVAPVFFDYVGKQMMQSRYGWARRTWWVLQAVSAAASLASGAHNLTIR
jgi:hypothetical protein